MNKLDQAIDQLRAAEPRPAETAAAADRVRQNLFGPGASASGRLRGCDDFRPLFPAYLQRALAEPKRLLVDDHVRGCVDCRVALDNLRNPKLKQMPVPAAPSRTPWTKWAIAAAMVVAAGAAVLRLAAPGIVQGAPATVQAVNGLLYRMTPDGSRTTGDGIELAENEAVETPQGSRAVLRLFDGSRVELNERSTVSVSRSWRGTTIRLARGQVIVEAAKQKRGRLYVASGDCEVAVKGTIFSVNRGLRGSRVSVVEGEVQVDAAGASQSLKPGQQATTDASLGNNSVADEVAWSANAARYLAVMGELNVLQKKLEQLPGSALRYNSRLLTFVPGDSAVIAAIPNLGNTVAEAKRIFDDQLKQSTVLRDWWTKSHTAQSQADFDAMVAWIQELGTQLGDEVIVAIGKQNGGAVLLAEVRGGNVQATIAKHDTHAQSLVYKGILIVASDAAHLQSAQAAIDRGGAPTSPFRDRVAQEYRNGAGWLFAADLQTITAGHLPSNAMGVDRVRYLIAQRRDVGRGVENQATLEFNGVRQGIPAWLGTPSALAALDFMTPEASAATAATFKSPQSIVDELLRSAGEQAQSGAAEFERKTGLRIDDLAASLGTEAAFALEGGLLPNPNWKAVVEVYQQQRLQAGIAQLVTAFNQNANPRSGKLLLASEQSGGRTFYTLRFEKLPWEAHYSYVDSYLVAGANRTLVTQAIQARQTGRTLARSQKFRDQLPFGANPNVSALVFQDMASALGPVADSLDNLKAGTPEQRESMKKLKTAGPSLVVAYGDTDRITAATQGSFFGLNLGMLGGLNGLPKLLIQKP